MGKVKPQPPTVYVDDPDERTITADELYESAMMTKKALCLARGGYFVEGEPKNVTHRTGRCTFKADHKGDHSWQR